MSLIKLILFSFWYIKLENPHSSMYIKSAFSTLIKNQFKDRLQHCYLSLDKRVLVSKLLFIYRLSRSKTLTAFVCCTRKPVVGQILAIILVVICHCVKDCHSSGSILVCKRNT